MKDNKLVIFMGMGFEIVGLMLGAFFLGTKLDDKFQTKGLITAGLSFACLISWLVHMMVLVKRLEGPSGKDES